jgi:hypothetical protein
MCKVGEKSKIPKKNQEYLYYFQLSDRAPVEWGSNMHGLVSVLIVSDWVSVAMLWGTWKKGVLKKGQILAPVPRALAGTCPGRISKETLSLHKGFKIH